MTGGPEGDAHNRDHLWVRLTGSTARIGLSEFAQLIGT